MKKIITISLVLAMLLLATMSAFAMEANAKKVMDKIEAPVTINGEDCYFATTYINQARSFLEGETLTEAQATEICDYIDDAWALIKAQGNTDILNYTKEKRKELLDIAVKAAKVVDVTITYNDEVTEIKGVDAQGAVVLVGELNPIKKTGMDMTVSVIALIAVLATVAGCGVVASKKKLFSAK